MVALRAGVSPPAVRMPIFFTREQRVKRIAPESGRGVGKNRRAGRRDRDSSGAGMGDSRLEHGECPSERRPDVLAAPLRLGGGRGAAAARITPAWPVEICATNENW